MKTNHYLFILTLFALLSVQTAKAQRTFVHPGALHTIEDLDRVKAKIKANQSPWKEAWQLVLNDRSSRNDYVARPKTDIGGSNGNRQAAAEDFYAAYLNFLRWYMTGDESHAECAVRICNAWSGTVEKAQGELFQIPIAGAMIAAELLRIYPGWKQEDIEKCKTMALNIFYPPCKNFLGACTHPSWDVQAAASVMAIGVFCDSEKIYNEAVEHFKSKDGYGSIRVAMDEETGQGFEMGRDQPHAALGNASLAQMCQIAWNQGDDLYGFADNLLMRGFDYYCKFNLNNPVDWKPVTWCRAPGGGSWFHVSTHDAAYRLRSSAVYEMVYNHYMVVKGLDQSKAPYLTALTNLARPEQGEGGIYLGHGTLMYTREASKSPLKPYPTPPAPTGLKATQGMNCIHLNWTAPPGNVSSGYEVYRSNNGGNYERIANWDSNSATKYTDNSIATGRTYRYYVKALNQSGISDASNIAEVTTIAASGDLPTGWGFADIGAVAAKGSAMYLNAGNNTFSVSGAGSEMGGTADGHGYAFTKVTGDATISARLYKYIWQSNSTKVGLVIRESLNDNSKRVTLNLGEQGGRFSRLGIRNTNSGNTTWIEGNDFTYAPIWFKIERKGDIFTAYQSIDGISWIKFATETVPMASSYYIGLSASSGTNTGTITTAEFDNVTVTNEGGNVPDAPASFTGTAVNSSTINLTWTSSSKAAIHILKRAESADGPFVTVSSTISGSNFRDTGLNIDTDYYYILKSANMHGESAESPVIHVKTSNLSVPPAPTVLKTLSSGNMYVHLQWNATGENTESYNIKRALSSTGEFKTIGNSTTNEYIDTDVVNGTTYYYCVSALNNLGESENSTWIFTKPALGNSTYFPFNEPSGEFTDVWNGKTAVGTNVTYPAEGKFNGAVGFSGADSYLKMPDNITAGLTNYTISFWIYLNVNSRWTRVMDFGTDNTNNMYITSMDNNGYIRYSIKHNGSKEEHLTTNKTILNGMWYNIVLTQSGSTGILYVNGKEAGRNSSLPYSPNTLGNTINNYFGRPLSSDPYMNGLLDDLRIYDKALTPELVTMLYKSKKQEITFEAIPDKYMDSEAFVPPVSTTSELELILESSNPDIAEIIDGKVHIKGLGTTDITARQTGNMEYVAALPATQTLQVVSGSNVANTLSDNSSIYPNPASGYFYITSGNSVKPLSINIYDMKGKLMLNAITPSGTSKIDIAHLNSGIYLLKVNNDAEVSHCKLIVTK